MAGMETNTGWVTKLVPPSTAKHWPFHGEQSRLGAILTWSTSGLTSEPLSIPAVSGAGWALAGDHGRGSSGPVQWATGEPGTGWALPGALVPLGIPVAPSWGGGDGGTASTGFSESPWNLGGLGPHKDTVCTAPRVELPQGPEDPEDRPPRKMKAIPKHPAHSQQRLKAAGDSLRVAPFLPLPCCVTLGKRLNLSVPPLPTTTGTERWRIPNAGGTGSPGRGLSVPHHAPALLLSPSLAHS